MAQYSYGNVPSQYQASVAASRKAGEAAGQDMSWMDQPNSLEFGPQTGDAQAGGGVERMGQAEAPIPGYVPPQQPSGGQQDSNQQPAVQQANQMGQAPFFQPAAPAAVTAAPQGQAAAVQPQTQAPSASPGSDPFASLGGGVQVNGGWVPKGHPAAQGAAGAAGGGGQAAGANLNGQPAAPNPYGVGQVQIPQAQQLPQYQSYNFSQKNVAPTGTMGDLAQRLATQASQQAQVPVAGLKEAAKETLLSQRQQASDAAMADAARRGVSLGGQAAGTQQNLADQFAGALTSQYRGIDQNAQQQGFQNLLQAAQAAQGLESQRFGQELSGQQFQQQQQEAQAGENAARNTFGLQAGTAQADIARQLAALQLQQQLGLGGLAAQEHGNQIQGQGVAAQAQNYANQFALGSQQNDLANRQFDEDTRRFGLQFAQQQAAAGGAASRADQALALQQANAVAGQQQDWLNTLIGLM